MEVTPSPLMPLDGSLNLQKVIIFMYIIASTTKSTLESKWCLIKQCSLRTVEEHFHS